MLSWQLTILYCLSGILRKEEIFLDFSIEICWDRQIRSIRELEEYGLCSIKRILREEWNTFNILYRGKFIKTQSIFFVLSIYYMLIYSRTTVQNILRIRPNIYISKIFQNIIHYSGLGWTNIRFFYTNIRFLRIRGIHLLMKKERRIALSLPILDQKLNISISMFLSQVCWIRKRPSLDTVP